MQIKMSEGRDGNISSFLLLHSPPVELVETSSPDDVQVARFICKLCPSLGEELRCIKRKAVSVL